MLIKLTSAVLAVTASALLKTSSHQLDSSYTFDEFVSEFSKGYVTGTAEFATRSEIFQSNLAAIIAHNQRADSKLETYRMGLNQFTDMKTDEMSFGLDRSLARKMRQTGKVTPNPMRPCTRGSRIDPPLPPTPAPCRSSSSRLARPPLR
jgi:hypothetical protein